MTSAPADRPTPEPDLPELLRQLFEFQRLWSKQCRLGTGARAADRVRMLSLRAVFSEYSALLRGVPSRRWRVPVAFTVPGGFANGILVDVHEGSLSIRTRRPPLVDSRLLVRCATPKAEYLFPCRVIWRLGKRRARFGAALDGAPTRSLPSRAGADGAPESKPVGSPWFGARNRVTKPMMD